MFGVLVLIFVFCGVSGFIIYNRRIKQKLAEQARQIRREHDARLRAEALRRQEEARLRQEAFRRQEEAQKRIRQITRFQIEEPRDMATVVEDFVTTVGIPEDNTKLLSAFMVIVSAIYQAGYQDGGESFNTRFIDIQALRQLRPAERQNDSLSQSDLEILRYINELYHIGGYDAVHNRTNRALVLASTYHINITNMLKLSQRFNQPEFKKQTGG